MKFAFVLIVSIAAFFALLALGYGFTPAVFHYE